VEADQSLTLSGSANSGADGSFDIGPLHSGSYTINVPGGQGGWADTTSGPVSVALASTTAVNVPMDPSTRVLGGVTDASSGSPLGGITVSVYDTAGNVAGTGTTISDGRYDIRFFETGPGSYKMGFSSASATYVTQYYNAKASLACADPLTLPEMADTSNINAAMTTSAAGLGTCASGGAGPIGGPGGPGGSGGGSGTGHSATLTSAQILQILGGELTPSGKGARLASILRAGGYSLAFTAPEAGSATVSWFEVPPGARLAEKKRRPQPVLVGTGTRRFTAAGHAKLKVKLTPAGRRLLKRAKHVTLTAKGTFTPTGQRALSRTKRFTIRP
jgi:hypothetical protein